MAKQTYWPNLTRTLLVVCLLLLALGALPAGFMLVAKPDGSLLGFSASWLAGSPFSNYTVPGLVLIALFGFGSLATIIGLIARPRWPWTDVLSRRIHTDWSVAFSGLIGMGLMIWIMVQVMIIPVSFLQPTLFGLGLVIFALSASIAVRSRQMPG